MRHKEKVVLAGDIFSTQARDALHDVWIVRIRDVHNLQALSTKGVKIPAQGKKMCDMVIQWDLADGRAEETLGMEDVKGAIPSP